MDEQQSNHRTNDPVKIAYIIISNYTQNPYIKGNPKESMQLQIPNF